MPAAATKGSRMEANRWSATQAAAARPTRSATRCTRVARLGWSGRLEFRQFDRGGGLLSKRKILRCSAPGPPRHGELASAAPCLILRPIVFGITHLAQGGNHQGRNHQGLTYRGAGVDIDAGDALVERIKPLARATTGPGTMGGLGGFGALFDLRAAGFTRPGAGELVRPTGSAPS